jgi:hypothetical protein
LFAQFLRNKFKNIYLYHLSSQLIFQRSIPSRWHPGGLKDEQIPLAARILSVVDVYDALTSDRPYRSGWRHARTLQYIQELSSSHFDPKVVEVFLKMSREE